MLVLVMANYSTKEIKKALRQGCYMYAEIQAATGNTANPSVKIPIRICDFRIEKGVAQGKSMANGAWHNVLKVEER